MDSEPADIPYCQRIYIYRLTPSPALLWEAYIRIPFSMTYSEGEREKGREREREEKTGYGFVITESFSYLCMRDRYLDRQTNRTSIVPPAHKN